MESGSSQKGKRRKLNRVVQKAKKKVSLNTSGSVSAAYYKKVKAALNGSLNASRASQTLKANNRALAQSLQRVKQDLRQAMNDNCVLRQENQDLSLRLMRLENQLSLGQDQNCYLQRLQGLKVVLNSMSHYLLDLGTCVNDGMDLCLVTPRSSQSSSTSRPQSLESLVVKEGNTGLHEDSLANMEVPLSEAESEAEGWLTSDFSGSTEKTVSLPDMSIIMEQSVLAVEDVPLSNVELTTVSEEAQQCQPAVMKKPGGLCRLPQRVPSRYMGSASARAKNNSPVARAKGSKLTNGEVQKTSSHSVECIPAPCSRRETFVVKKRLEQVSVSPEKDEESLKMLEPCELSSASTEENQGKRKPGIEDSSSASQAYANKNRKSLGEKKQNSSDKILKGATSKMTNDAASLQKDSNLVTTNSSGRNLEHRRVKDSESCVGLDPAPSSSPLPALESFLAEIKQSNRNSSMLATLFAADHTSTALSSADRSSSPEACAPEEAEADSALQPEHTIFFDTDMDFTEILVPASDNTARDLGSTGVSKQLETGQGGKNKQGETGGHGGKPVRGSGAVQAPVPVRTDAARKEREQIEAHAVTAGGAETLRRSARSKGRVQKTYTEDGSDDEAPQEENERKGSKMFSEPDEEESGEAKSGDDKKSAVALRVHKPGQMVFTVSRKEEDGSRKAIPVKPTSKARSKSKKQVEEMMKNLPQAEPEGVFDFHDRTPRTAAVVGKSAQGQEVFDLSLNDTVPGTVPSLAAFREKHVVTEGSGSVQGHSGSERQLQKSDNVPTLLGDVPVYNVPLKDGASPTSPAPPSHSRSRSASNSRNSQRQSRSKGRSREDRAADEDDASVNVKSQRQSRSKGRSREDKAADEEDGASVNVKSQRQSRSKSRSRADIAADEDGASVNVKSQRQSRSKSRSRADIAADEDDASVNVKSQRQSRSKSISHEDKAADEEDNAYVDVKTRGSRSQRRSRKEADENLCVQNSTQGSTLNRSKSSPADKGLDNPMENTSQHGKSRESKTSSEDVSSDTMPSNKAVEKEQRSGRSRSRVHRSEDEKDYAATTSESAQQPRGRSRRRKVDDDSQEDRTSGTREKSMVQRGRSRSKRRLGNNPSDEQCLTVFGHSSTSSQRQLNTDEAKRQEQEIEPTASACGKEILTSVTVRRDRSKSFHRKLYSEADMQDDLFGLTADTAEIRTERKVRARTRSRGNILASGKDEDGADSTEQRADVQSQGDGSGEKRKSVTDNTENQCESRVCHVSPSKKIRRERKAEDVSATAGQSPESYPAAHASAQDNGGKEQDKEQGSVAGQERQSCVLVDADQGALDELQQAPEEEGTAHLTIVTGRSKSKSKESGRGSVSGHTAYQEKLEELKRKLKGLDATVSTLDKDSHSHSANTVKRSRPLILAPATSKSTDGPSSQSLSGDAQQSQSKTPHTSKKHGSSGKRVAQGVTTASPGPQGLSAPDGDAQQSQSKAQHTAKKHRSSGNKVVKEAKSRAGSPLWTPTVSSATALSRQSAGHISLSLPHTESDSQEADRKRGRRAAASVCYKEPSLTAKLRRGDPHTSFLHDEHKQKIYKSPRAHGKGRMSERMDRSALHDLTNLSIAEMDVE